MAKIQVEFLGPIGLDSQEFDLRNLVELKEKLSQDERLKEWLKLSAVAINNEIIESMDYHFRDGDKIVLLPPVCGG